MDLRPYSNADRNACLAVFDSNSPAYFNPTERANFENFLNEPAGNYLVMEHDDAIVGCGGYSIDAAGGLATLEWGMVRRDLQRQGLGRFLLMFRLREIGKNGAIPLVRARCSKQAAPFFEKLGFRITGDSERPEMVKKLLVCA